MSALAGVLLQAVSKFDDSILHSGGVVSIFDSIIEIRLLDVYREVPPYKLTLITMSLTLPALAVSGLYRRWHWLFLRYPIGRCSDCSC